MKTGGIALKKKSDKGENTVGHYIAGDYIFLDDRNNEQRLTFESDTYAWFLDLEQWGALVAKHKIDNFLHFLSPEEITAGNEKHNNNLEPETIVSLSEEHVSDKKLNIKDFFLSSEELEKIHKKKFKYVLQHDAMDCGAASMATVADFMVDGLICQVIEH